MCKAHSKVTHIKQQIYFHHLKGRGCNKNSALYPGRFGVRVRVRGFAFNPNPFFTFIIIMIYRTDLIEWHYFYLLETSSLQISRRKANVTVKGSRL